MNLKHQRSLFLAGLLQDYGKHTPDVDVSGFISRVNGPYVSHAFKSRGLDHHPLVSSTFVETHLNEDKRLADLVLHHHAREDGTGFPQHIGENQLPIDHQILIIANEMSDRLDKLGGHNHLLSCLPALRLGKVLYFNKAHAAWLEMLKPLVPDDPAPLSYSECQQLQFKRDHLEKVLSSLLAVSGELLRYDFDLHVHGLRSNIQKIARLFAETGLLNKALFEKACSEEAGGSCQFHDTLIEVQALFKALPETLGRCADQLDYLLNHPEFDVNQVVLSEALARLKRCVAMLTPVRSSIFR
ncbi:MAG: HD domain-containing phosphohydrolase [Oleiphilaceae bacterium]|nr:HD domain-containing phosphohydrolase [Oleiphilaceae bacterium]